MTAVPAFDTITWRLFLNTPKMDSAGRIVSRLGKLLGTELEVVSLDPYWKDPKLIEARLQSLISETIDPAEATYMLMRNAQRLARGFSTSGPQTYEGGLVEIQIYATSGFVDAGIGWLEATVRNFEPPGPERDL